MDSPLHTPLLDLFRRGDAPYDVRLMAARGALAPRAHEQVALLMLLVEDEDENVRATAQQTITRIPVAALSAFLARADVAEETCDFFGRRGITPAQAAADGADEPLVVAAGEAESGLETVDEAATEDAERLGAAQRLARLPVAERMKRAMLGSREERFILIRDNNRLVAAAVLSSPKVTQADVESIAKMANVSDEVLRIIGTSRAWVRQYSVAAALALNPKTPIAVSLAIVPRLVERDIKAIVRDRNMPEPVRMAARRVMLNIDARRG